MGPTGGFIAGFATLVEFVFAPPAMKMVVGGGVIAVFSDEWISFGGLPLTANTVTMASLFKLRASGPLLECPFRAPFHPLFPAIALVCGLVCLFAVVNFNAMLSVLILGLMALACGHFRIGSAQRDAARWMPCWAWWNECSAVVVARLERITPAG